MSGTDRGPVAPHPSRPDALWLSALGVVAVGILLQAASAVADRWVPSGDDGYWSMMARSVFSSHPPLLGSSSSGAAATGYGFHHLGPVGFYLLAPFVAAFGGIGVAIGTSVINAVCAVTAAVAVRSAVGQRAGWFAVFGSALLAFAMGSELLVDPWNPHLATFAFWCALCCCWAVLSGSPWWAVPGVVAGSVALQTHLSFVPPSALVILVLLLGAAWAGTHSVPAHSVPDHSVSRWRGWLPVLTALAVGLVLSLPMLIQQFFADGPGNLSEVLSSRNPPGQQLGLQTGLRTLSQVFDPTNFLPKSWFPQVIEPDRLASIWVVLVALLAVIVLDVLVLRRRLQPRAALSFALLLLLAGVWFAARLPVRLFGVPMALVRWAWPLSLFVCVVSLDALCSILQEQRLMRRSKPATITSAASVPSQAFRWGFFAAVVVLTLANLVPRDEGSGARREFRVAVNETISDAGQVIETLNQPLIKVNYHPLAAETTVALMDYLDERGLSFAVSDPVVLGQAGTYRAPTGTETVTVVLAGGSAALDAPAPGFERIAITDPLSDQELRWFIRERALVEERLGLFLDRYLTEKQLQEQVRVSKNARLNLKETGWAALLCGEYAELPVGSQQVEQLVVSNQDRQRLCSLSTKIEGGLVAVDVGPPPQP